MKYSQYLIAGLLSLALLPAASPVYANPEVLGEKPHSKLKVVGKVVGDRHIKRHKDRRQRHSHKRKKLYRDRYGNVYHYHDGRRHKHQRRYKHHRHHRYSYPKRNRYYNHHDGSHYAPRYWHEHKRHGYRHRYYNNHHYYNNIGFYFPGLGHIKHNHVHGDDCSDWHYDAFVSGVTLATILND